MEDPEKPSPFLVVVAGPNGSGKTTITDRFRAVGIDLGQYINADEITLELLKDDNSPTEKQIHSANRKAQSIAESQRQKFLENGESLSFETVMSHPSKVDFMREAKARGYEVSLYFVGTDDPLINLVRVSNRVQEGGHDVPTDKILSRYERVMDLLPSAVAVSDYAEIYDNSDIDNPLQLVAAIEQGKTVLFLDDPPHWVTERLLDKLDPQRGNTGETGVEKDKAAKASDFLTATTQELLKKYPGDQAILAALAIREVAGKFAGQHFTSKEDRDRFMQTTNNRLAHNLAHGKINQSPLIKAAQQNHEPPRQER